MAKSIILNSASYDGRYLQLSCTQTNNPSSNTSTINWTLSAIGGNSNYYDTGATTVTINGQQVYYMRRVAWNEYAFPAAKGSVSGSLVVNHNTDGSKAISVSLSTAIYYASINTTSNTWTLDNNPRGAKITSAPDFTDETQAIKINYSNPLGNNATSLRAFISADNAGNNICVRDLTKTGTEYTFTLTQVEKEALWAASVARGSDEFTIYFVIETTVGSYTEYNSVARKCSIVNCMPTMNMGVTEVWALAQDLVGDSGKFIKGYSTVAYNLRANAVKGATIVSHYVTNGSFTSLEPVDGFTPEVNTITYAVRDSRNKRIEETITIDLVDYFPVTLGYKARIEMSGEVTAKAIIDISGSFFNDSFGAVDNEIQLYIKDSINEEWTAITKAPNFSNNNYSLKLEVDNLDYSKNYVFQLKVVDKLTEVETKEYTLKVIPVFDWSDSDFNFNVPVSIGGNTLQDFVIEQGTKDSWSYRKWNSGVMECWRRLQITANVNSAWGSLYTSGAISATNLSYPYTFTELPMLTVNLMPFGAGGLIMMSGNAYGSASNTGALEIARGTAYSNGQYLINYYAIGRWK